jgi:hypothetical protein
MTKKLIFLLSESRFIQRGEPLLQIRRTKIWLYLILQIIGVAAPVAISQTIAAIGGFHIMHIPYIFCTTRD